MFMFCINTVLRLTAVFSFGIFWTRYDMARPWLRKVIPGSLFKGVACNCYIQPAYHCPRRTHRHTRAHTRAHTHTHTHTPARALTVRVNTQTISHRAYARRQIFIYICRKAVRLIDHRLWDWSRYLYAWFCSSLCIDRCQWKKAKGLFHLQFLNYNDQV